MYRKLYSERSSIGDISQKIFEAMVVEDLNVIGSASLPTSLQVVYRNYYNYVDCYKYCCHLL
jgi:hypothetical protein